MTPVPSPVSAAHCSLNVGSLDASIAYYRALTGGDPVKRAPDYAKFELTDPPLVLSLIQSPRSGQNPINHVGFRVPDIEALETIRARLGTLGLETELEQRVECCYSTQTKFWTADPDGTWWEVYVYHDEAASLGRTAPEAPPQAQAESDAHQVWAHRLADGWPDGIPHADGTLDEVLLEGSINLRSNAGDLEALLRDARRVLKPHGTITVHGLVASQPVAVGALGLPGPAAAVERVPVESEPSDLLAESGFIDVRIARLAARAHFSVGGAEMREILLTAQQPGVVTETSVHRVVYRGPLASVTDDAGTVYVRGQRTYVTRTQYIALLNGPSADDFVEVVSGDGQVLDVRDACC